MCLHSSMHRVEEIAYRLWSIETCKMIRANGPVKKGAPAMPPPTAAATSSNGNMGPPPGMSILAVPPPHPELLFVILSMIGLLSVSFNRHDTLLMYANYCIRT